MNTPISSAGEDAAQYAGNSSDDSGHIKRRIPSVLFGERQNYTPVSTFSGLCGSCIAIGDDGERVFAKTFTGCKERTAIRSYALEKRLIPRLAEEGLTPARLDVGKGERLIVQQLVDGVDLDHLIRYNRLTNAEMVRSTMTSILDAGTRMHNLGVVHRDFKPANILIPNKDETPNYQAPLIIDFGFAKEEDREDHFLDCVGTPWYQAPEQRRCEAADKRSDIYSAGVTLYELAAGLPPEYKVCSQKRLLHVKEQGPLKLQENFVGADARIRDAIKKATQPSPDQRFQHFSEMKDALNKRSLWRILGNYIGDGKK